MKKSWLILILFSLCTVLLLGGCGEEGGNTDQYGDMIAKTQEIAVTDAATQEVITTISSEKEIEAFVEALDITHWQWRKEAPNTEASLIFVLSQAKTANLGESIDTENLHEICTMYTYKDQSLLTMEVGELSLSFEIPTAVSEALNAYLPAK